MQMSIRVKLILLYLMKNSTVDIFVLWIKRNFIAFYENLGCTFTANCGGQGSALFMPTLFSVNPVNKFSIYKITEQFLDF